MNHSLTILLVEDTVKTVGVRFHNTGGEKRGTEYTYKTTIEGLEVDDIVVVETGEGTGTGYSLAVVSNLEAQPDFDSSIAYKWVVASFKKDALSILREQEKKIVDEVRNLEMKAKRKAVRDAMIAEFGTGFKKLLLAAAAPESGYKKPVKKIKA